MLFNVIIQSFAKLVMLMLPFHSHRFFQYSNDWIARNPLRISLFVESITAHIHFGENKFVPMRIHNPVIRFVLYSTMYFIPVTFSVFSSILVTG